MIVISEYAFAKLAWFRINCTDDNVDGVVTKNPQFLEVSLMGVSESPENIGYINDFVCVPQECSSGLTEPDDDGMNTYLETMFLDKGMTFTQCGRFWAHTHPGTSPTPSGTDDTTFTKWFGHTDVGVMYILAKGDDSCKVKHASKYFGMNVENMPVYVELNKLDDKNNKIILSTKTLFAIDKIGVSDSYDDISNLMFDDYSDKYELWMKELRENVKKKAKYTPPNPTSGHYTNTNYQHFHSTNNNHNHATKSDQQIQNNLYGTGRQISTNQKISNINVSNVIDLLITNRKNAINEFSKVEKNKIYAHFNIAAGELQHKYNELLNFERSFDYQDLLSFENVFISNDGKSKFENLSNSQLVEYCKQFMIRPSHLKSTIDKFISVMHNMPKLKK